MNKKGLVLLSLLIGCMLVVSGELINKNSSMELGLLGAGVPGVSMEDIKVTIEQVAKEPTTLYVPYTVAGGNPGQCMLIKSQKGVSRFRIELEYFLITEDCEVEISFDAKRGSNADGKLANNNLRVDFRAWADTSVDKSGYPFLSGFAAKPTSEWQKFSKRFKIKKYSNYYTIWLQSETEPGKAFDDLYIDNLKFARVDGKKLKPVNEYAVMVDKESQIYNKNDKVNLSIRMLCDDNAKTLKGLLTLKREHNKSIALTKDITLTRQKNGVYTANVVVDASEYGSFIPYITVKGKELKELTTAYQVLHKPVVHAFGSPGWGIGTNQDIGFSLSYAEKDGINNYRISTSSFERSFDILRSAGNSMVRVWGFWRGIEDKEGELTTKRFDPILNKLKKYNMEPMFIIAGNLHSPVAAAKIKLERGINQVPEYMYRYFKAKNDKNGAFLPPMDIYEKHLSFLIKNWGKQIKVWEFTNESGLGGFPAKEFIDYTKTSYKLLKAANPENIFLSNGVTGDFGMNTVKWCEQLNAVDPNYVDYVDGIAFHPYGSGVDYSDGVLNLYRDCINNISGTLKKPRPLWNTEAYYLKPAYKKQIASWREYALYGANDLVRSVLDGYYNGLVGTVGPAPTSFYQRPEMVTRLKSGNEVVAAQNALSALLKDMVMPCHKFEINAKVRSGYFTNKDKSEALGFIYDMRSCGSKWTPGKGDVIIMDIYGNVVKNEKMDLKFEPYYIKGKVSEVEKVLKGSAFEVDNPIDLVARVAGDKLFIIAKNNLDSAGVFDVQIGDIPTKLNFKEHETYKVIVLDSLKEMDSIEVVANTKLYNIPEKLTLPNGSVVDIKIADGNFIANIAVKDKVMAVAKDKDLYSGSAVELFFDNRPFEKLEVQKYKPLQYVFGAVPSKSGVERVVINNDDSKATHKVEKVEGGYNMTVTIPMSELKLQDIFGLDIVVSRGTEVAKESLGGEKSKISYKERLHYPLFKRSVTLLNNGNFAQIEYGDCIGWNYSLESGTTFKASADYGYNNSNGVQIERVKASSKAVLLSQSVNIKPDTYRKGRVVALLRYEEITAEKPGRGFNGLVLSVNYKGNGANYAKNALKRDIVGLSNWTIIEFDFDLNKVTDYVNINIGLGPHTTGKIFIDNVELYLFEK